MVVEARMHWSNAIESGVQGHRVGSRSRACIGPPTSLHLVHCRRVLRQYLRLGLGFSSLITTWICLGSLVEAECCSASILGVTGVTIQDLAQEGTVVEAETCSVLIFGVAGVTIQDRTQDKCE